MLSVEGGLSSTHVRTWRTACSGILACFPLFFGSWVTHRCAQSSCPM